MLDKQKILNEVYEHLHKFYGIHTKGEFADAIHYARAYISSAMNGNKKYLTEKLFRNIHEAFPNVFDLDYLLTGVGNLVTDEESYANEETKRRGASEPLIDTSSVINAALAAKSETIESLKRELSSKIEQNDDLRSWLKEKDDTIEKLKASISSLKGEIERLKMESLEYPFPIGASESGKRLKNV